MFKILLAAAAVIVLVFAGFGLQNDMLQRSAKHREVREFLTSVGRSEVNTVRNWFEARLMLIEATAEQLANEEDVTADFFDLRTLNDNFRATYYGTEEGQFHLWPKKALPAGFDPRGRPWYKEALAKSGPVITAPYRDASSGRLTVSAAAPVIKDGRPAGVIGGDFDITYLTEMLNKSDLGGLGYLFVTDAEGTILIHPEAEFISKSLDTLFPDLDVSMGQEPKSVTTAEGDRLIQFVPVTGLPVDWQIGLSLDRPAAFASLSQFRNSALVATLIATLTMLIILGGLFRTLLARPLAAVTRSMAIIADGDLETDVPSLDRRDEIGSIAAAVEVFRTNGKAQRRVPQMRTQSLDMFSRQDAKAPRREIEPRCARLFDPPHSERNPPLGSDETVSPDPADRPADQPSAPRAATSPPASHRSRSAPG